MPVSAASYETPITLPTGFNGGSIVPANLTVGYDDHVYLQSYTSPFVTSRIFDATTNVEVYSKAFTNVATDSVVDANGRFMWSADPNNAVMRRYDLLNKTTENMACGYVLGVAMDAAGTVYFQGGRYAGNGTKTGTFSQSNLFGIAASPTTIYVPRCTNSLYRARGCDAVQLPRIRV